MGDWGSAFLFGLMLVAFVLGLSSIIMSFFQPVSDSAIKHRIEYGFFGVSGLIVTALMLYAIS
ncbi:hypothetical protein KIH87_18855 [Paraneptunicella aestuarii]|uniref:hypothetical protein n=1 Tax=Paraneptunicella aestuarii TaxID=2831148 RepID=UPI001E41A739|nr:hypothetical protein [Paraneptunicella aestuarii]UAA38694.1 hypothetical protein KIH87_18855 [Paraneptunicella aestuarii]